MAVQQPGGDFLLFFFPSFSCTLEFYIVRGLSSSIFFFFLVCFSLRHFPGVFFGGSSMGVRSLFRFISSWIGGFFLGGGGLVTPRRGARSLHWDGTGDCDLGTMEAEVRSST